MKNLGDTIATVAQPIARGIDTVFGTNIRNCYGCKKMQHNLNAGMSLADAFYDRFWESGKQKTESKNNIMQYVVNKTFGEQIAIEANDPKEAIAKVKLGEGNITSTSESYSASPRPTPPQPVR